MSFHQRKFRDRMDAMGDEAEGIFRIVHPRNYVRTGLDRPPLQVYRLSAFTRYTPDYLTSDGYVEVQGFGSDNILKVKLDKIQALEEWQAHDPVQFFLWHRPTSSYCYVPFLDLAYDLVTKGTYSTYDDGNQFYGLKLSDMAHYNWTKFDDLS